MPAKRTRTKENRDRYRKKAGIPVDAPLYTHSGERKPRADKGSRIKRTVYMNQKNWKAVDSVAKSRGVTLGEAIEALMDLFPS